MQISCLHISFCGPDIDRDSVSRLWFEEVESVEVWGILGGEGLKGDEYKEAGMDPRTSNNAAVPCLSP